MDFEVFYKNLAKNIKHYRSLKNLTQEELAELAGISIDYLGKIEICKNKPGLIAIIKIINALDISFAEFFFHLLISFYVYMSSKRN